jgi:class 3 adenylate cyclase
VPVCPTCGQENPEIARFCLACATPLGTEIEPREERKIVTVLFADLVGFTSRAERLDPEDVRAMLSPYYAAEVSALSAAGPEQTRSSTGRCPSTGRWARPPSWAAAGPPRCLRMMTHPPSTSSVRHG